MTQELSDALDAVKDQLRMMQDAPVLSRMHHANNLAELTQDMMELIVGNIADLRRENARLLRKIERITPYHDETAGFDPLDLPTPANDDGEGNNGLSASIG